MTRVLVTGAGGQLGRELQRSVPDGVDCLALGRGQLDIADSAAVSRVVGEQRPEVLINAAAYTAVDQAETEADAAMRINAEGAGNLAAACAEHGVRMLHISTDFVFDGNSSTPYTAEAATSPLGEYGRSKLAGEEAVRNALPAAVIMRTAWVYSAFGGNFVKTMLRLMAERDTLSVVADQVGTPTWANGLARALWQVVDRPTLQGIYHWTDAGVCSWYDFAVAIAEESAALGLLDCAPRVLPIPGSAYPTPARRPSFSVLDKQDTWEALGVAGVHWRVQLRKMLQELKES
ncbi:dTDP-4-dehydrorhamnose reductase [Pseudohalioglobus sediminis]|uniref:dTDP-4-dehydrorhamnose reductase n=1 Tax=Pseudohalioglobus sediminis TaxID=2606449 RepID=A0A5B0WU65_9GAMM|nr:dTDP-4-dehydrorhamnose reductase [Pseudohalioglobus sediminis]KAA1190622.1 dTDP-4-dehydrorhamnose reductase [Pseudohalioglobus sediminis]